MDGTGTYLTTAKKKVMMIGGDTTTRKTMIIRRIRLISVGFVVALIVIQIFCMRNANNQYLPKSDLLDESLANEPTKNIIASKSSKSTLITNSEIVFAEKEKEMCAPLQNVSNYTHTWERPVNSGTQLSRYQQCLRFTCDWKKTNYGRCNNWNQTNYDGPEPPCCVHTLRDMAKAVDDIICELGFEVFASYGMLLGLVRDDKLIPWTMDNDYIATQETLSAMLALRPEEKAVFAKHGISFFYDHFFRFCITPDFMDGKLAKNWKDKNETNQRGWYPLIYPYSDIFVAREEGMYMVDELNCAHPMETFRPLVRTPVYNQSFVVSMPHRPEDIISVVYGPHWRTPDNQKSPHGNTRCAKNQYSRLKAKINK